MLEDSDCVKYMQVGLSVCGPRWRLGGEEGALEIENSDYIQE